MKYLISLGIALAFFVPFQEVKSPSSPVPLYTSVQAAPVTEEVHPVMSTKEGLILYAVTKAEEAGLNPARVKKVIDCETSHTWNPDIQSGYKYKNGEREQSFGLAQIHLPAHPDITKEQATDPYFAIDWLISEWKEGRQWQWSCYNMFY